MHWVRSKGRQFHEVFIIGAIQTILTYSLNSSWLLNCGSSFSTHLSVMVFEKEMKPVKHKLPLPKQLAPGSSGQSQSFHVVPRPWCQWSSRAPYAAGQGPSVRRMKKIFNGRCIISCLPRGCLPVALCSSSPTDPSRAHISRIGPQLFHWVRMNSHLLSLLQHPLLGQRVAHLEICSHDILNKTMLLCRLRSPPNAKAGAFSCLLFTIALRNLGIWTNIQNSSFLLHSRWDLKDLKIFTWINSSPTMTNYYTL